MVRPQSGQLQDGFEGQGLPTVRAGWPKCVRLHKSGGLPELPLQGLTIGAPYAVPWVPCVCGGARHLKCIASS